MALPELPPLHHLALPRCVPVAGNAFSKFEDVTPRPATVELDVEPRSGAGQRPADDVEALMTSAMEKLAQVLEKGDWASETASKSALLRMLDSRKTAEEWLSTFSVNSVTPKLVNHQSEETFKMYPFWDAPPMLHLSLLFQVPVLKTSQPDFWITFQLVRCKMLQQILYQKQNPEAPERFELDQVVRLELLVGTTAHAWGNGPSSSDNIFRDVIKQWLDLVKRRLAVENSVKAAMEARKQQGRSRPKRLAQGSQSSLAFNPWTNLMALKEVMVGGDDVFLTGLLPSTCIQEGRSKLQEALRYVPFMYTKRALLRNSDNFIQMSKLTPAARDCLHNNLATTEELKTIRYYDKEAQKKNDEEVHTTKKALLISDMMKDTPPDELPQDPPPYAPPGPSGKAQGKERATNP